MARKILFIDSIFTFILLVHICNAQVVWSGANSVNNCSSGFNSNWLIKNNWCGGILPDGNTSAIFGANGLASAINISMGVVTLTTTTTFGCIELAEANTTSRTISNSSPTYPGNIYLNGLTVNGNSNVILSNSSSVPLTINSLTGASLDIVLNNPKENVINIDGKGDINLNAIISGKGKKLVKSGTGSGVLNLSAANSYDGGTVINSGTIVFTKDNSLGQGDLILNGGVFQTKLPVNGAISAGNGVLKLMDNSTIQLGDNIHTITFSPSSTVVWTQGKILTIKGWKGPYDGTSIGAGGRIYIGNNGLTSIQLLQIHFFDGYSYFSTKLNAQYIVPDKILPPEIISSLSVTGMVNKTFYYQIAGTNSPTSYRASNLPAGLSINTQTGIISGTPTVVGSFTINIYAINSSGSSSQALNIGISEEGSCAGTPMKSSVLTNVSSFCAGGSTTLQLSNYTDPAISPGINMQWYSSTNNIDFKPVEGSSSDKLSTGTITETTYYYNKSTCSYSGMYANSDTVCITVFPIPAAPEVNVENNCGSSVLTTSAPGDLLWNNGEKTNKITVQTAGKYSLITTVDGCTSSSSEVTASPKLLPTAIINNTSGTSTITCYQTTINLSASGGTDYLWWKGSELISNSPAIDIIAADTYFLSVTGENGCSSQTSTVIFSDLNNPGALINTSSTNLTCVAPVLTLIALGNGSYLWSTGEQSETLSVSKAGTYTLTVTGNNGCQSQAKIDITSSIISPAAPVVSIVNNCGYSVLIANNYTGDLMWNTGEATQSITVTTPGTYSVHQTLEGCKSVETSVQVNITQTIGPISASNNSPLCAGSSLILDATAITNANYLWSGPNGFSSNSRKATIRNATAASSGDYSVVVTLNGCASKAAFTHVIINSIPTPVIFPSGPTNFCKGGKVTLSTSDPYSQYQWNTGSTQPTLEVTNSGSYYLTVIDNGCYVTSAPVTISVNSNPQAYNLTGAEILCNNSIGEPFGLTGSQRNVKYNLYIDDIVVSSVEGTGKPITFPLQAKAGIYSADAINSSGCRVNMNGHLNVRLSTPIDLSFNDPEPYAFGTSANTIYDGWTPASTLTLTANTSGGSPPYNFSWINSAGRKISSESSLIIANTSIKTDETFTLKVSDVNGCSTSSSRKIYYIPVSCSSNRKEKGVQVCIDGIPTCVASTAVENILANGGTLGSCLPLNILPVANTSDLSVVSFSVRIYPNPSRGHFKLQVKTNNKKDKINLEISDITGRIVSIFNNIPAEKVVEIGGDIKDGMYIINIVQGNKQEHVKVIKLL